jgi:hypothetical protein
MYRYYLKTLIKTWFNCSRSDNSDFRFPPYFVHCNKPGKWEVIHLCVNGMYFASFYNFDIGVWHCYEGVVFLFYYTLPSLLISSCFWTLYPLSKSIQVYQIINSTCIYSIINYSADKFSASVFFSFFVCWSIYIISELGDNCIVFENFTASIGILMVANRAYWRRVSGASKRIFAMIT